MNIQSPLEQFTIIKLYPITIGTFDISFTNSSSFILIACSSLLLLFFGTLYKSKLIPTRWQSFGELLYEFVLSLVSENIGSKGFKYFPLMFCIFSFILCCNLLGMIPYSFIVTSLTIITFCLSLGMFCGIVLLGFITYGLRFFSLFFPHGTPLYLAPLIVPIEIVSFLTRPISLAIRLAANMLSGHSLLKILVGFAWTMLSSGGLLAIATIFPLGILVVLMGLEIGIAILQAYVFTVLLCIFINEALHLH